MLGVEHVGPSVVIAAAAPSVMIMQAADPLDCAIPFTGNVVAKSRVTVYRSPSDGTQLEHTI